MKIVDAVFALISGYAVGWVARDFLQEYGVDIGIMYSLLLHYLISLIFLFVLWLGEIIGKKFLFVFQATKHLMVGALATVIDLKIFESAAKFLSLFFPLPSLLLKAVSFLAATAIKYWGNKHWAFEKHEKEDVLKEVMQFFAITIVGLVIDVGAFYYFNAILGPQLAILPAIWLKLSVIAAAVIAAVWNFTAYKFLVFKK